LPPLLVLVVLGFMRHVKREAKALNVN